MPSRIDPNLIAARLSRFRSAKIRLELSMGAWDVLLGAVLVATVAVTAEAVAWFSPAIRTTGSLAFLLVVVAGAAGFTYRLREWRRPWGRYGSRTIALEVGRARMDKSDLVLNALDLADSRGSATSEELAEQFVREVATLLDGVRAESIYSREPAHRARRRGLAATAMLALSLVLISPLRDATVRWSHPRTTFTPPAPFTLVSRTGDLSLLSGLQAEIVIEADGVVPQSLLLELSSGGEVHLLSVLADSVAFRHTIPSVTRDISYRAVAFPESFWAPWDSVSTPSNVIRIQNRPRIIDLTATVTPPAYTGLSPVRQKEDLPDIRGYRGSRVEVALQSDQPLAAGYLGFSKEKAGEDWTAEKIPLRTEDRGATGVFLLDNATSFRTRVVDFRGIENSDPILHRVVPVDDLPPLIKVLSPESPFELGSDMTVPVKLRLEDDFGFSGLRLLHETRRGGDPSTGVAETQERLQLNVASSAPQQDFFLLWDVAPLELMPEDEVHFRLEVLDNDEVSGPKKVLSPVLVARFPSIEDLFERAQEKQATAAVTAKDVAEELREVKETLQEAERELLKQEKPTWEQEKQLAEAVEMVREQAARVEELGRQLEEMTQYADKHNLFSPSLMEKLRALNQLLSEVITPEMLASIEQLEDVLRRMDRQEILDALAQFAERSEEVEQELDRFLEILKRVKAEQEMDEVASRLDEMIRQQESVVSHLKDRQAGIDPRETEREERLDQEFDAVREKMESASDAVEPFAREPASQLEALSESDLAQETSEQLTEAAEQMRQQKASTAGASAKSARGNLGQMQQQFGEIRSQFQEQTLAEMSAEFQAVVRRSLSLSKEQEALRDQLGDLPAASPRTREFAKSQQVLRDQLSQLTESLLALSRKTLGVTPAMGKALGRASAAMNGAVEKMEERNVQGTSGLQGNAVSALNELALASLHAMEEMQQSGSASGLKGYLERMQQMTGAQQGVNGQTLQLALGQAAAAEQEGMMRRLGEEQGRIRKSLEELMREMRGAKQGGGMDAVLEEMDEVLRDLAKRQVGPKTVERQERILSRMLHSEKALKEQDLSEERKSRTVGDVRSVAPAALPHDLGQRKHRILKAMEEALRSDLSADDRELVRKYFNALAGAAIDDSGATDE